MHHHIAKDRADEQAFFKLLQLLAQTKNEQAAQAGAVLLLRLLRRIEGTQGNAAALIDKCGKTNHHATIDRNFEQFWQIAEGPAGQSAQRRTTFTGRLFCRCRSKALFNAGTKLGTQLGK